MPDLLTFLSRPKLHDDETLESYIIRVSYSNMIPPQSLINFSSFCDRIKECQYKTAPVFRYFNPYHSKSNLLNRYDTLDELSLRVGGNVDLKHTAVKKAQIKFSNNLSALQYKNIEIPSFFYRREYTPVCPHCLSESEYIRISWHLVIVNCCEKHKTYLLEKCPKCKAELSYILNHSISECHCGYDLKSVQTQEVPASEFGHFLLNISLVASTSFKSGKPASLDYFSSVGDNIYNILYFTLFFHRYIKTENDFTSNPSRSVLDYEKLYDFFASWPTSLHKHLDHLLERKLKFSIRASNTTGICEIFGPLLLEAQNLPDNSYKNNLILREILCFFQKKLEQDKIKRRKNQFANMLLTKQETAIILGVNTEKVATLTAEGYLTAKLKKLEVYIPIYPLGEVFRLWNTKLKKETCKNMPYYPSYL